MEVISVLIVLIATLAAAFAASYAYGMSQLDDIKMNWVKYRCNPVYMPLAGIVGSDVASNFMYCTLQSVNTYAGFALDPIYKYFKILTDAIRMILNSMNSMRAAVNGASSGFLNIAGSVIGKMQNSLQVVMQLMSRTRVLMNRMIASFAILMNIVTTGVQTGQSVANGPIGRAGQFLSHCFHPDTPIAMLNNVYVPISRVEPGNVLANGRVVKSVLEFEGMETPMFMLDDIVVSGNHKVRHGDRWIRVDEHPDAVEHPVCPRIFCLNVEGREMYIGGYSFKDYEETDDPAILKEFFEKVQAHYGTLRTPQKTETPLGYRFTGLDPMSKIIMEDGSERHAFEVEIGDRLLYGGSVIGRAVHDSVELTQFRGCVLAQGTWLHDPLGRGVSAIFGGKNANGYTRGQAVQFLTETGRYAAASNDRNELVISDVRDTPDITIWKNRDSSVQKQPIS
jgi:hypothetical protein